MPALLPLLCAALGATAVAWLSGVPLGVGTLVLVDVASLGAFVGALLMLAVSRRPRPWRALTATAAAALAAAAHLLLAPAAPAVLILVVDCLRADRLAPATMPNTWTLTSSSARFTQARSQSSWTRSSMPSLLSGRYPIEHGLFHTRPRPDRIHPDVTLLAERFQAAGWLTAGFVEQPQLATAFGFGRGFDRYGFHDGGAPRLDARFLAWNTLFRTVPRFALLHYVDAHGPYTPKARFVPKDLPKSTLPTRPSSAWRALINDVRAGKVVPTPRDWAHLSGLYDAQVRQLDQEVGRLFRRLAADGTLDAAWLVVTADHGERFGEHGDIEHMGAPDEAVLSVPLLVRPPGGTSVGAVDSLVQHVDLAPTLLHAVGLPVTLELPGRDLAQLFTGATIAPAPSFAEEWYGRNHRVSAREGDWKLVLRPAPRLYDLASDPGETTDRATEHPEIVARLQGLLAAYFAAADTATPIATVDWAAAATSGATWTPSAAPDSDDAAPSDGTMEALEKLGYLEEEGSAAP